MSTLSGLISAGGGSLGVFKEYVILSSQTFTIPLSGKIKVTITGGGGAGSYANSSTRHPGDTGVRSSASGGGGGGFCQKTFAVTAGETFAVVVGVAGGANGVLGSTYAGGSTTAGTSTFATSSAALSVSMSAVGGGDGNAQAAYATGNGAHSIAGGVGGTASGGDLNYTGGRGGTISHPGGNAGHFATGGGAVSVNGIAYHGGDSSAGGNYNATATGGAGVGGHGLGTTNSIKFRGAGGGSSTQNAVAATGVQQLQNSHSVVGTFPTPGSITENQPIYDSLHLTGAGGYGHHNANASAAGQVGGVGGGGGGASEAHANYDSNRKSVGGKGGAFGGGGAACGGGDQAGQGGGRGGFGGGGGGGAVMNGGNNLVSKTNLRGGQALCLVQYIG